MPANWTTAFAPPIVTVGTTVAFDNGLLEAGEPVGSGWSKGPSPVTYITTTLPTLAGLALSASELSGFRTTAWFVPVSKIPGSTALTFTIAA